MSSRTRFCWILPLSQVSLAALLGGFGLWQRNKILNHDYLFGIGWDTTLRFHVWPWPFKFVLVTNAPAFLSWALIGCQLERDGREASEMLMAAPSLLLIALLWLAVGRWIDRHWASSTRLAWGSLLGFTLICAAGASVPSTTFYLLWGVLVWIVVGCRMAFVARHRSQEGQ
jgi:hypothetical protein